MSQQHPDGDAHEQHEQEQPDREREREIEVLRSRIEEAGKERRKMECTKRTAAEKGS